MTLTEFEQRENELPFFYQVFSLDRVPDFLRSELIATVYMRNELVARDLKTDTYTRLRTGEQLRKSPKVGELSFVSYLDSSLIEFVVSSLRKLDSTGQFTTGKSLSLLQSLTFPKQDATSAVPNHEYTLTDFKLALENGDSEAVLRGCQHFSANISFQDEKRVTAEADVRIMHSPLGIALKHKQYHLADILFENGAFSPPDGNIASMYLKHQDFDELFRQIHKKNIPILATFYHSATSGMYQSRPKYEIFREFGSHDRIDLLAELYLLAKKDTSTATFANRGLVDGLQCVSSSDASPSELARFTKHAENIRKLSVSSVPIITAITNSPLSAWSTSQKSHIASAFILNFPSTFNSVASSADWKAYVAHERINRILTEFISSTLLSTESKDTPGLQQLYLNLLEESQSSSLTDTELQNLVLNTCKSNLASEFSAKKHKTGTLFFEASFRNFLLHTAYERLNPDPSRYSKFLRAFDSHEMLYSISDLKAIDVLPEKGAKLRI